MSTAKPIHACILALHKVSAAAIYLTYEDLMGVGRLNERFDGDTDGTPGAFWAEIVGLEGVPVESATGLPITPRRAAKDVEHCDIVFIPPALPSACFGKGGGPPQYDASILEWIRTQYINGSMIVSLCSGSYVLAATGLLDGLPATCHWASKSHFQACYPQVNVQASKPLIVTGEGGRLVIAGTGSYHPNLIIYLIQRLVGKDIAHHYAKLTGKFWIDDKKDIYARLTAEYTNDDQMIREAQQWFSKDITIDNPVEKMADHAFQTERTFARRFKKATGFTPQAYVQAVRVERARNLLESTRKPVQEVSIDVGYKDISSFRRIFSREVGMPPSEYRRRFKLPPVNLDMLA